MVPLAGSEMAQAAVSFPIAFAVIEKRFTPVALLGVQPGQNLYVAPNGMWAVSYIPAAIRGFPFKLLKTSSDAFTLGVDEASGLVVDRDQGQPFFKEDGSPHDGARAIFDFMVKVSRSQEAAVSACAALTKHGVIEPWPLKLKHGDEERPVPGLNRINEAALNALEPEAFLELRQGSALALAYSQLISSGNLALLGRLGGAQAQAQKRQPAKPQKQFNLSEESSTDIDLGSVDWDDLK